MDINETLYSPQAILLTFNRGRTKLKLDSHTHTKSGPFIKKSRFTVVLDQAEPVLLTGLKATERVAK